MAAVPNYSRFPGPGDFSPPAAAQPETSWQDAICRYAEKLKADDTVSEVVEELASETTWLALHNVLSGHLLSFAQLKALERLRGLCRTTIDAVDAEDARMGGAL